MKRPFASKFSLASCALVFLTMQAETSAERAGQQAYQRTYAQNYRDMVLATCIDTAYKSSRDVAMDAGSSVSALRDWTRYDLEASPDAIASLVQKFLSRDYTNPLVETEVKDVRFDLLKCFDLYHSKELDGLAARMVAHPQRIEGGSPH
jgi:isocitrate lyase